jgi:hypothetical protein
MESTRAILVGAAVGLAVLVLARPVAAGQNVTPEGVKYSYAKGAEGQIVVQAEAGDLRFEKSVFPDGRTVLVLKAPDGDVLVESSDAVVVVQSGSETYRLIPDGVDERTALAARVALTRSQGAQLLRNLRFAIEERGAVSAFDYSALLSAAVVSELLGETGAIRRHARKQRGTGPGRIRKAAAGQFSDCWSMYEQAILSAFNQYLRCIDERSIASWKFFNLSYCDIRYTMQAESAWFQFLSCSSIRIY